MAGVFGMARGGVAILNIVERTLEQRFEEGKRVRFAFWT